MLRSCPRFLRGRLRSSLGVVLRERSRAKLSRDPVAETRAWKLFRLIPMLLFHRPRHSGTVGRNELAQRADDFARGSWRELWTAAREHPNPGVRHQGDEDANSRRRAAAQSRVERGQVSRARHELTGKAAAGEFESPSHVKSWISRLSLLCRQMAKFSPNVSGQHRREVPLDQEGLRMRS